MVFLFSVSENKAYKVDYFTIEKYNPDYYKLVFHKCKVRKKGFELIKDESCLLDNGSALDFFSDNDERFSSSFSRARSKIFEYAMCNKFDYFITLTLSKNKYDRYNLDKYIKDLGQKIRDWRKKYNTDIQYLLIPEQHKDGAWHLHGLINGIPSAALFVNEFGYLDWFDYKDKFGWCSLGKVRSKESVSKYITKYISKDLGQGIKKNSKLYYVTRGLKTKEKVHQGSLPLDVHKKIKFDFENDYVGILSFNDKQFKDFEVLLNNSFN